MQLAGAFVLTESLPLPSFTVALLLSNTAVLALLPLMLTKTFGSAVQGVNAYTIIIEVVVSAGTGFNVVG